MKPKNALVVVCLVLISFVIGYLSHTSDTPEDNPFSKMTEGEKLSLSFPFEYLPEKDWLGGTDTWAIFSGEVEYQSYPTMDVKIPRELYSSERKVALNQIQLESKGESVTDTLYFDVDKDDQKEKIISICSTGANHCPDKQEIIKDNMVIFSLFSNQLGGSIEPTATGNGFYANWYTEKDLEGGLCCALGNTKTRFIYKDNSFIPIFEQRVGYIEVVQRP